MKSGERHKLHQNALAVWLARTFTTIKPYQNVILGGVIAVILAVIVTTWRTSESASQANSSWTQFFTAFQGGNPSDLEKVAEDNPRSHAAPVADLAAADIKLAQGCNLLFVSKATANQELNKAAELYEDVRRQTGSPTLRAQATFGLARAWESLGKLETAMKLYTEVTTDWPDTVYAQMSLRRLADLKRASIKEIYDKFAQFDPKPAFSQPPGEKPSFDKLPDEAPIFKPGSLTQQKAVEEQEQKAADNKTEESKPDKPADAQQSPDTDKPTSETTPNETSSATLPASDAPPKN